MDNSKILTADLLDLIFDDRNKLYGAYELRKNYSSRVKQALLITAGIIACLICAAMFRKSSEASVPLVRKIDSIKLIEIEAEPDPIQIEEPKTQSQETPQQARSEIFVEPEIVPDEEVPETIADQESLSVAVISNIKSDGPTDIGIVDDIKLPPGNGIIQPQKPKENEIQSIVQIQARFDGNWERFLIRNLDPEVPLDNGAPPGKYTAIIQFVVDLDGSISQIVPLTSHGFGIEEDAIRVIQRSKKWEPGIQNGYPVKSYRNQPITFIVEEL